VLFPPGSVDALGGTVASFVAVTAAHRWRTKVRRYNSKGKKEKPASQENPPAGNIA